MKGKKQMKKSVSVVVLLVLILGLWGGATYWFSLKAEQQYRAILKEASQPYFFTLTNEHYNRGFLESQAQTVLEIQLPKLPPNIATETQSLRITLAHDIIHGPFPLHKSPDGKLNFRPLMAVIQTKIILPPEIQSRIEELYGQIPEIGSMRDYTLINLDGSGEEHFFVPAFRHTLDNPAKTDVDFGGLSVQVNFTPLYKSYTGSLSLPSLAVSAQDLDLKLTEVKYALDVHDRVGALYLGDATFDLGSLQVTGKKETEPQTFLMHGFKISSSSRASGDTVGVSVSFRVDQLKLDETAYGPGDFELVMRNLDAGSLASLEQMFRELQSRQSQQSVEEFQTAVLNKYVEMLPELL